MKWISQRQGNHCDIEIARFTAFVLEKFKNCSDVMNLQMP